MSSSESDSEFLGFDAVNLGSTSRTTVDNDNQSDISVSSVDTSDLSDFSDVEQPVDTPPNWKREKTPITVCDFEETVGPTSTLTADKNELDFLDLLFPPMLYALLATETNRYAKQCQEKARKPDKQWADNETTATEIRCFLGIHIYMSIVQLPSYKSYWSSDHLFGNFPIKHFMIRSRFEKILQYFHTTDSAEGYQVMTNCITFDTSWASCRDRPLNNTTLIVKMQSMKQWLHFAAGLDFGSTFPQNPTSTVSRCGFVPTRITDMCVISMCILARRETVWKLGLVRVSFSNFVNVSLVNIITFIVIIISPACVCSRSFLKSECTPVEQFAQTGSVGQRTSTRKRLRRRPKDIFSFDRMETWSRLAGKTTKLSFYCLPRLTRRLTRQLHANREMVRLSISHVHLLFLSTTST